MKTIKSLVLGSAAGLLAVGGAQAADLPVKAKAVEYVRICSLYGAGFFYIPGTDTCVKLGGYLRVESALATNTDFDGRVAGVGAANNRYTNYYTSRARQSLDLDTRTATEYGVVRTFATMVFSWTDGSYSGNPANPGATVYQALGGAGTVSPASAPQNANPGTVGGASLGLYNAFIQFAGFTVGRAVSQFSAPWTNYPGFQNFDGLPGGGGAVTGVNQFTYTAQFGNGVSATLSAQDQVVYYTSGIGNLSSNIAAANLVAGSFGAGDIAGTRSPDLVASLKIDQAWGLFQLSAAAHDNHAGYYTINTPGAVGISGTEAAGHPGDKWGWAIQGALQIKNIPTGPGDTIMIQGVYTEGASRYNFQDLMATSYAMFGGTGVPGAYQSVGFGFVTDSVFVTGGEQQLTKTYGFRGGYTHNWDPYWSTSVYGGWAAVRYNDTSKAFFCAGNAGLGGAFTGIGAIISTGVAGCNPDFNYSAVGLITRWTPVKNLAFSADLTYVMLDQKFAAGSTFTVPGASVGIGKPAAVYELKDQNALQLHVRAQRNF
jgi:hypothetical protein